MSTRKGRFVEKAGRDLLFCLLIASAAASGCVGEKKELNKAMRQQIETLARTSILQQDSVIKAACDSIYNYWLERAKDSIYEVRIREIQQIKSAQ